MRHPAESTAPSQDDSARFVSRHLNRNIAYSVIDGTLFSFGIGMVPLATTLTYFVSYYIESNLLIGLLATMNACLMNLPQLFAARYIESIDNNRRLLLYSGLLHRLCWMVMGAGVLLLQDSRSLMILFYLAYGLFSLASGVVGVAWMDMIAKVFPASVRGRIFGVRSFLCSLVEFLGALLAATILERVAAPTSYALLFFLTGLFGLLSMFFLNRMREPNVQRQGLPEPLGAYLKRSSRILVEDPRFFYFMLAMSVALLGGGAAGFRILYAKAAFAISASEVALFTLLWICSRALSSLVWGFINDRLGYRFTLIWAHLLLMLSFLILLGADWLPALYLSFVLHGAWEGAIFVSQGNYIIELGGEQRRATYLGLSAVLFTPAATLGPLLMGALSDGLGYKPMFALAALAMLLMVWLMVSKVVAFPARVHLTRNCPS